MSMIKTFFSFRGIDQCLILMFIVFAVGITVGLILTSKEELCIWVYRKLNKLMVKLEGLVAVMNDDEPFDPEWMDYDAWKETRP